MHSVTQTLSEFGKRIGLAEFGFNDQGIACLEFQNGRQFVVEAERDEMLIYQVQPTPYPSSTLCMKALQLAELGQGAPFPYQVGMLGSGQDAMLVVLTRVPAHEFSLPMLERTFELFHTRWNMQGLH